MLLTKQPAIEDAYLATGLTALAAAEQVILGYFGKDLIINQKSNQSPVTIADQEAEQVIKKMILKKFPGSGFIGEEEGSSKPETELTWIIDPIDGTRSFIKKLPWFGTLLALVKKQELIMGISYMPQLSSLAYAIKGKGSFFNHLPMILSSTSSIK